MMESTVFSQFDDILAEDLEIAKDMVEQLKNTNQAYIIGHDIPISVSKMVFERVDFMRKVYAQKYGVPEEQFEFEDLLGIWSGLVPDRAFYGERKFVGGGHDLPFPFKDLEGDELNLKIAEELYKIACDIGWVSVHHGRFMDTFNDTTREVNKALFRLSGKISNLYDEYEEKLFESGYWSRDAGEFEEDELRGQLRGQEYIEPVSKRVSWTDEKGELQSATVDAMCAEFMQKVNAAGHKTIQSCSGAMQDHPGARCGWDMSEGYVSFIVDESFGDYGMFPPDKITPYAIELYNAINDAGWCPALGTTLFVPTVTARPTCLGKNPPYILWGDEFHGHNAYEYLKKHHPEALKHPTNTYHKEAIAAGPYTVAQKEIIKKWDAFDKFKCETITNDQVMKRKWNDLLKEVIKVEPREWT